MKFLVTAVKISLNMQIDKAEYCYILEKQQILHFFYREVWTEQ